LPNIGTTSGAQFHNYNCSTRRWGPAWRSVG
jgi:hypothetical protein